jgi:hypothetical protein
MVEKNPSIALSQGRRCRHEVKGPTPMISEPFYDVGIFMRSVIVGNGMDDLSSGDSAFRGVEKLDEFLVGMFWHAAPDHGSIEDIEGGKERRRADTLVSMGHGPTLSGFERQARLGAIGRLDLALLVDGDGDGNERVGPYRVGPYRDRPRP